MKERFNLQEKNNKYQRTERVFGFVNKRLESRNLHEGEALGDGVQQEETISPADGGLQRRRETLLDLQNLWSRK